MSLNVNCGNRLEVLAEKLFESWDSCEGHDPFARTAIVVGDMATKDWLQDYFLFNRENTRKRKVLANIDFVPLAQFVNDWLVAQTHKNGRQRRTNEHPYSKNVLAWRINGILSDPNHDERLGPLYAYIGTDERLVAKRCFELSTRIAQLYDDYIGSRPDLLDEWSQGNAPDGVDEWQGVLYQKLVAQYPQTYNKDYAEALDESADLEAAYANGFPRYEAVHVFDVAFSTKPFLCFLERIAHKLPVTFWNFNPVKREWTGELMGALASNAHGVLDFERSVCGSGLHWIGDETDYETLLALKSVEVHACHSPRRELGALRNGLREFFERNEYAKPRDVLVLCADWATYSPLVEAVFGTPGDEGYIPVSIKGRIAEETPIQHAFSGLLDFKDNRFEVSAVMNLLTIPAVRRKFEIDVDSLSLLRDMVREANIHWGYDDELGGETRPYTWRRGLDRLTLDALMGERENPDSLEDVGVLGRLRPCGHVESERAVAVGKLDGFVRKLHEIRGKLNGAYGFAGWRDVLTSLIDDFFLPDKDEMEELSELRVAVASAARDIRSAWYYAGVENATVSAPVFIAAVLSQIKETRPNETAPGDAVRFASLTSGSATPARFVWICGLNDGTFPKSGIRSAFDFIGRNPTEFDSTARDKDLFAFLKAAFGAREKLALSYVGKNVRSNEEVPPSVSLTDLVEWFGRENIHVARYEHPLQSYSPWYYLPPKNEKGEEKQLPLNFSKADHTAAENLLRAANGEVDKVEQKGIAAFVIKHGCPTNLELDDIIEFMKRPSTYLMKNRLRIRVDSADRDVLEDVEAMDVRIPSRYKIALSSSPAGTVDGIDCEAMVEMGKAPNAKSVQEALDELVQTEVVDDEGKAKVTNFGKIQRRTFDLKGGENFSCDGNVVEALAMMNNPDVEPLRFEIALKFKEHEVNIRVRHRAVQVCGLTYVVSYDHYKSKDGETSPETIEMVLRHLAGHAGGYSFTSVVLRGDGTLRALLPISQEEARRRLESMLTLLFDPLPPKLPDLNVVWQDDKLPQELFVKLVDGLDFIKSVARKGKAK